MPPIHPPYLALPTIAVALVLTGCGPEVELETDESSGAASSSDTSSTTVGPDDDDDSTTREPGGSSTTHDQETTVFDGSSTTHGDDDATDTMPPDTDGPEPTTCGAGAGDLALEWSLSEPGYGRADAVAVGAGRVAWAAGEFFEGRLWVLDTNGNPIWDDDVPLFGGEAEPSYEGLVIDPDGNVALAGTILDGGGYFDGLLRWYDPAGNVLAEDIYSQPGFDIWQGLARMPDGDVVAAGESNDAMFVRRYTAGAAEVWSRSFSESGALWSSQVSVAPSGTIFVSGHSNQIPGPVLLAYDAEGTLLWSHFGEPIPGFEVEIASSVAADDQDRAWMTVISDIDTEQRVERYVDGGLDLTIPLDFRPNAIAVDPDGALVVAGAILDSATIVVERYDENGTQQARYERDGRFATGVAVDEDCHAYVVGFSNGGGGAWLERLR